MRWEPWLDLVLPRHCAGCGRAGVQWCRSCTAAVAIAPRVIESVPGSVPVTVAGGTYAQELKAAVLVHKRTHHADVAALVSYIAARSMALALDALPGHALPGRAWPDQMRSDPLILVPVPGSAWRPERVPMGETASVLAAASRSLVLEHLLVSARRRPPQKGLDAAARTRNIAGAFALAPARRRGSPGRVILLDDVVTTGASLTEAARTLRTGGYHPRAAVVIARASLSDR